MARKLEKCGEGSCGFLGLSGFAAGGVDEEGNAYADDIENEHGRGEEAHADGVRQWGR